MSVGRWIVASVVGALVVPSMANAYSKSTRYARDTMAGGGGGRFFTGAPGDGFTCGVCHGQTPGPSIKLAGAPDDVYEPGETYEISIQWDPADQFAVSASVAFDDGAPAGTLALEPFEEQSEFDKCAAGPVASELLHDARYGRSVAAMIPCGATRLDLVWTAPERSDSCGSDAVLYIAGVAGDDSDDPEGDQVSARIERWELSGDATAPSCAEASGCRVGGESDTRWGGLVVLLGLGFMTRRRRR